MRFARILAAALVTTILAAHPTLAQNAAEENAFFGSFWSAAGPYLPASPPAEDANSSAAETPFGEPGPIQDSIKMGALGSFLSALLAIFVSRLLKVQPITEPDAAPTQSEAPKAELATA